MKYQIIIPQEKPKQETIEEKLDKIVSKEPSKYWKESDARLKNRYDIGFYDGFKHAEKVLYSEEDLRKAFNDGQENIDYDEAHGYRGILTEQQWFEKFLKKISYEDKSH